MSARQPLTVFEWDDINEALDQLQAEAYAHGRASVGRRHPETDLPDQMDKRREGVRAAILRLISPPSKCGVSLNKPGGGEACLGSQS
mgnify:CR=1 FL=1